MCNKQQNLGNSIPIFNSMLQYLYPNGYKQNFGVVNYECIPKLANSGLTCVC
jgi:hypothetical protein